ncbi:MAG: hypothetical protein KQJ78_02415 [Deltaproteobacteria bacterium]|nr:hypothetical protein [Deltaproteobacteria bacterium]
MPKHWKITSGITAALSLIPTWVLAAGDKATEIIVVADTRKLTGIMEYIANLYNENMWLFATWAVVLTTLLGVGLGIIMDFFMKRTGIDLSSREIVEH